MKLRCNRNVWEAEIPLFWWAFPYFWVFVPKWGARTSLWQQRVLKFSSAMQLTAMISLSNVELTPPTWPLLTASHDTPNQDSPLSLSFWSGTTAHAVSCSSSGTMWSLFWGRILAAEGREGTTCCCLITLVLIPNYYKMLCIRRAMSSIKVVHTILHALALFCEGQWTFWRWDGVHPRRLNVK